MTYEDLFVAIATEAPNMTASALKLLLHLIGRAIEHGTSNIQASDRQLSEAAGIARSQLADAKRTIAQFFPVAARQGATSAFALPASWFPPQRMLFSAATGPENRPVLARNPGQCWPGIQASAGPESTPTGMETGPEWTGNRARVDGKPGQSGRETGPVGLKTGPAHTANQQLAAGPSISIESKSGVVNTETVEILDRVLDAVQISPAQQADADTLKTHLHAYMQQLGKPGASRTWPSDEIAAKCLAVAPVDELLIALASVANAPNSQPGAYIWFVVVFLDRIRQIPWKVTKQRMDERRQRKQPGRAGVLPFPTDYGRIAAGQVKTLR